MRRLSTILFAGAVSCIALDGEAADCFHKVEKPERLLFVGNSYTYYHNMPEILSAIGAANSIILETKMVASGGATLGDHVTSGDATTAISRGHWNYVFLQEQSSFGDTFIINGRFIVRMSTGWRANAVALSVAARASGAIPVLLAHWAKLDEASAQPVIDANFAAGAKEAGACLIRTSPMRALADKAFGRKRLYVEDGSHPTELASYLYAALLFRDLTGVVPKKLPSTIAGHVVEEDEGKISSETGKLATLTPAEIDDVRAVVAESAAETLAPPDPAAFTPKLPVLLAGEYQLPAARPSGTWSGPFQLIP